MFCVARYYLLTPRSTVLLDKPTGLQLVKKFPTLYATRMFITAFTTALPAITGKKSFLPMTPALYSTALRKTGNHTANRIQG